MASRARDRHIASGHCERGCGREIVAGSRCGLCALKHALREQRRKHGTAPTLDDVWAQYEAQGRACFYTGAPLVWGVNASVDHAIPRSKGGDDARSNIRIVHSNVNWAKLNLDESEFLSMVRLIAARFPRANEGAASLQTKGEQ